MVVKRNLTLHVSDRVYQPHLKLHLLNSSCILHSTHCHLQSWIFLFTGGRYKNFAT
jgi:hypothetical protein